MAKEKCEGHDLFAINSAIETLIRAKDGREKLSEAAEEIIAFAKKIRESESSWTYSFKSERNASRKLTGFTPESGNLTITHPDEKYNEEYKGRYIARAGYYRVWRRRDEIFFQHWKQDFSYLARILEGELNQEFFDRMEIFFLKYDIDTFSPLYLGLLKHKISKIKVPLIPSLISQLKLLPQFILYLLIGKEVNGGAINRIIELKEQRQQIIKLN